MRVCDYTSLVIDYNDMIIVDIISKIHNRQKDVGLPLLNSYHSETLMEVKVI